MSATSPDVAALVGARLCHDLISPIGAIGNGLELLQLSAGPAAAELALVNESLANALAKLRFFRVAFGPADAQARQSMEEAAQLTDTMFHGRLTVGWPARGRDMDRPVARILYLAILCLERSLPMGGHVRISQTDGGFTLAVDGRRTAPPEAHWAHVTTGTPVPDLKPDSVQFALLRLAIEASGRRIEPSFGETSASLRILDPMLAEARP